MHKYHKIPTVWKRDPATNHKTLIEGEWATPELAYLAHNEWVFTEKIDGTNIRVMWDGQAITFGGKTDRAQLPAKLVKRLNEMFLPQTATFADKFDCPVCLYGEGYGAGIQKGGGDYGATQEFALFDVKVADWWLQREDIDDVAGALSLYVVPVVGAGTLHDLVAKVSNGIPSLWGPFSAEGIVARPAVELFARNGKRIITKLKCRDFAQEATP